MDGVTEMLKASIAAHEIIAPVCCCIKATAMETAESVVVWPAVDTIMGDSSTFPACFFETSRVAAAKMIVPVAWSGRRGKLCAWRYGAPLLRYFFLTGADVATSFHVVHSQSSIAQSIAFLT